MPKVKPSDLQVRRSIVKAELEKGMTLSMLSRGQTAEKIDMPESTYNYRIREPENIRLEELWKLGKVLHLTDEQLLRIAKVG